MSMVPDFGALAQQQQGLNDDATRRTTWSQRPDQSTALGNITWNQDASGRWINNTSLTGAAQGLFDQSLGAQSNLTGQVSGGVNYGNLPAMPDSGFGASQQVIDAWNSLQRPGLDKNAADARNRAAAMGLTIGSNANNDIERTIGVNESEARNQGILRGTQEYGNVFNRGMAARKQAADEAEKKYSGAMSGLTAMTGMRDSLNPNKWASTVKEGAAYRPMNVYGAAQDTLGAFQNVENAATAQSNANRTANMGLLNSGLNAAGQIGWGNIGSGISNLWNWGSNMFRTGGESGNNNYITPADWEAQAY